MPAVDQRGPEFARLTLEVLDGLKQVFKTSGPVVIYSSTGTGALEASLVNTLSPGDKVLMSETGFFSEHWRKLALRMGLETDYLSGDWRHGVDPAAVEKKLVKDRNHDIKAVMVVHNETSTGVTSRVADVRRAMDRAEHPALMIVDTISSLASIDYCHDEWGVDVTVCSSQKGFMLPTGLGFNAISEKALSASKVARLPRSYWGWDEILETNKVGFFPFTPASHLMCGLRESLQMLLEEGLENVFARHHRLAEATRRAIFAWGLKTVCVNPEEYSNTVTGVLLPEGHDADQFREVVFENFSMSLGSGLGKLKGKVFRIGHLGDFNDLMLAGTLSGIEMGLAIAGVSSSKGGVSAALDYLADTRPKTMGNA
jgi:alanine-glyoxylate transaminase/serine-glyoxylate transaminase/serine-pyruvate transaminase